MGGLTSQCKAGSVLAGGVLDILSDGFLNMRPKTQRMFLSAGDFKHLQL